MKQGFFDMQTRLLCRADNASLQCKEALFVLQVSLTGGQGTSRLPPFCDFSVLKCCFHRLPDAQNGSRRCQNFLPKWSRFVGYLHHYYW